MGALSQPHKGIFPQIVDVHIQEDMLRVPPNSIVVIKEGVATYNFGMESIFCFVAKFAPNFFCQESYGFFACCY